MTEKDDIKTLFRTIESMRYAFDYFAYEKACMIFRKNFPRTKVLPQ